jgi:hypothetical protein
MRIKIGKGGKGSIVKSSKQEIVIRINEAQFSILKVQKGKKS